MNKQEIFDTVKTHLLKQNEQAWDDDYKACAYLDQSGNKCAVGCLIPDGHPAQQFRGSVSPLFANYPDLKEKFGDYEALLIELQYIHDSNDPDRWAKLLDQLAKKENL